METVVVILCGLTMLAVVALGIYAWRLAGRLGAAAAGPLDHLGELVRVRVIVHTRDDRSIRGVLVSDYPDCIVLDAPEYLGEPQIQEIAGRAVILRPNLAWIQVLSNDGS